MTLQEWIVQEGGPTRCARKHGLPRNALGTWNRLERFPRPVSLVLLGQLSAGVIDFDRLQADYVNFKSSHMDGSKLQKELQS